MYSLGIKNSALWGKRKWPQGAQWEAAAVFRPALASSVTPVFPLPRPHCPAPLGAAWCQATGARPRGQSGGQSSRGRCSPASCWFLFMSPLELRLEIWGLVSDQTQQISLQWQQELLRKKQESRDFSPSSSPPGLRKGTILHAEGHGILLYWKPGQLSCLLKSFACSLLLLFQACKPCARYCCIKDFLFITPFEAFSNSVTNSGWLTACQTLQRSPSGVQALVELSSVKACTSKTPGPLIFWWYRILCGSWKISCLIYGSLFLESLSPSYLWAQFLPILQNSAQTQALCTWGACSGPQLCPALYSSMDWTPPGSPVQRIFQARIQERVAVSSSTGMSLTQGLNPCLLCGHGEFWPLSHPTVSICFHWRSVFWPQFSAESHLGDWRW